MARSWTAATHQDTCLVAALTAIGALLGIIVELIRGPR